jgi:phosphonate transport system substrate-binding protein
MKKYLFSWFVILAAILAVTPGYAAARNDELRFAITSAVASDPSYSNYRELTRYLAGKMGEKSVLISGLTYDQVDNLFLKGLVDVGFLCNCHYARRKSVVKFEPIAAPIIAGYGKPKFQIYIIVPKDSPIRTLADMKGKSVDFADPLSTTTLYAQELLRKRNETIQSFFRKSIYSGSHDMTIELVANKMVDIGFIDGHIWDYHNSVSPVLTAKTKIIQRSQDFTIPPVVVRKGTPEAVKQKLRHVLLTMQKDSEGREILKKLHIEKFIDIRERDYEDVVRLYDVVNISH